MENENIKRKLIIASVILLIVIILTPICNNFLKKENQNHSDKYLILGNYLVLQKTGKTYKQIKKLNDDILNYKYKITTGENEKSNVKMQFLNNKWYFFDDDYNEISMPNFKAATHNWNIQLANYQKEIINRPKEDIYIDRFFSVNDLEDIETYKISYKTIYDLDNDGNDEVIYTLNNYSLEVTDYDQNGYMFVMKNNNIIYHTSLKNTDIYTVMEIIDLDNDGNHEIIVNKGSKDLKNFNSKYKIYTFKNNKFKAIK